MIFESVAWGGIGTGRGGGFCTTISIPLVTPRFNDSSDDIAIDVLLNSLSRSDTVVLVGVELKFFDFRKIHQFFIKFEKNVNYGKSP